MNKLKLLLALIFTGTLWITLQPVLAQTDEYIIRRGDVIDVVVMEHTEFNIRDIIVLPDGTIQYPGFGQVVVAGMSTQQLADSLENMLHRYVVNPIVSVFIRRLQDQSINVLGHVTRPGQYQVFEPTDLFSAIGKAGGIRSMRRVKEIVIYRSDQTVEVIPVSNIFDSNHGWVDLPTVYAGDTVFVMEPREINWSRLSFLASVTTTILHFIRYFVLN